MKNSMGLAAAMLAMLLTTAGCGPEDKGPKTVPAGGKVTLDGEPVSGAAVVFIDDGGQYPAQGYTDENGDFTLRAFEYKDGAVPGSYKVIVTRTVVGELANKPSGEEAEHAGDMAGKTVYNDLPKKYASPTGILAYQIPEEGVTDLKLELTSD